MAECGAELVGPGHLLCSSSELQELQTASPAGLWLSSTAAQEQLADSQHSSDGTGQLYSLLFGEKREKLLEHSVSLQYRREDLMCRVHSVPLQFITGGFDSPALFLSNCGCFTVNQLSLFWDWEQWVWWWGKTSHHILCLYYLNNALLEKVLIPSAINW